MQAEKKWGVWAQHFVSCTISQLLSVTLNDEVLKIRNAEISQVIFVGITRHAEKAPTKIIYKTDDGTAVAMDVCQWVDTEDASGENTVVTPEAYLNVTQRHTWTWLATSGLFRTKRGWWPLRSFPWKICNEFTARIVEVINSHMMLSKSNNQPSAVRPSEQSRNGWAKKLQGNYSMPENGLTVIQNQVLNLIMACPRPEGLNFQNVRNQLHTCSLKQTNSGFSGQGGARLAYCRWWSL